MPAARYWRIARIETFAGGDLELSEVALYEGATRVDGAATVSAVAAPVSGSLDDLGDASFGTSARWAGEDVRLPGFAFVWDFGAGITKDVTSAGVAGPDQFSFAHKFALEYSIDGTAWTCLLRTPKSSKYPGSEAFYLLDATTGDESWRGLVVVSSLGLRAHAYSFDGYTLTAAPQPFLSPQGYKSNAVAFSIDGSTLALTDTDYGGNGPVRIYTRDADTFRLLSAPALESSEPKYCLSFSADGAYLAVGYQFVPFMRVYKRTGDAFSLAFAPTDAQRPASGAEGLAFSPDGGHLVATHSTFPFITIYKRSGDTFVKLSDPTNLPANSGYRVAFSPDGTYLAVSHGAPRRLTLYKRSGDTFTKLADPVSLPSDLAQHVAFSPDGTYLAVDDDVYKRSGDTFTKLSALPVSGLGGAQGAAFSPDGGYLASVRTLPPYLAVFQRSGDTFTKLADPLVPPGGFPWGLAWSPFTSTGAGIIAGGFDATPTRMGLAESTLIGEGMTGYTQPILGATPTPIDIYDAGHGRIVGTVKEKNTPSNTALNRRVVLLSMPGSRAIRETWSDAETGAYEFTEVATDRVYTVVSYDHTDIYRAVLADNLRPELMR